MAHKLSSHGVIGHRVIKCIIMVHLNYETRLNERDAFKHCYHLTEHNMNEGRGLTKLQSRTAADRPTRSYQTFYI